MFSLMITKVLVLSAFHVAFFICCSNFMSFVRASSSQNHHLLRGLEEAGPQDELTTATSAADPSLQGSEPRPEDEGMITIRVIQENGETLLEDFALHNSVPISHVYQKVHEEGTCRWRSMISLVHHGKKLPDDESQVGSLVQQNSRQDLTAIFKWTALTDLLTQRPGLWKEYERLRDSPCFDNPYNEKTNY